MPTSPEKDEFRLLASVLTSALAEDRRRCRRSRRRRGGAGAATSPRAARRIAPPSDEEADRRRSSTLLDEQGFAPESQDREVTLRRCPYYDLAEQHPEVVCSVHKGLIAGAL